MNQPTSKLIIAYFISPHGFGHASRAAAVMNALNKNPVSARKRVSLHFEIFTLVPRWFFHDSVSVPFTYHKLLTDIGLAQESSLKENVAQTIERLNDFLPFDQSLIAKLASRISKCNLVMCDIAPLGIAVAQHAGIPSILIENFTWDWIYAGYHDARFNRPIAYLRKIFHAADYHIQTEPVCQRWHADLTTTPVSRAPRVSRSKMRDRLSIPKRAKIVLITMGGIPEQYAFLDRLKTMRDVYFIVPGASKRKRIEDNLILLPHHSEFYHPDLMNVADVVIGKAGYSTVSEAFNAGISFGFVAREKFRESATMARFIKSEMRGVEIPLSDFQTGNWLHVLNDLLTLPRAEPKNKNGAARIAEFVLSIGH